MIDAREVLPHSGEMVLIDEIVSFDDDRIVARTTIREGCPFFRSSQSAVTGGVAGVPSWVGVEYMAQTVAAWNGLRARAEGQAPKSGFLIGTKKYQSNRALFPLDRQLTIEASLQDKHGPLGVFECRLHSQEIEVEAILSIYEGDPPTRSEPPKEREQQ